jgi:hypothetical protein
VAAATGRHLPQCGTGVAPNNSASFTRHATDTGLLSVCDGFTSMRVVEERALDIQGQLARVGHHRLPPVDVIVAAIGDVNELQRWELPRSVKGDVARRDRAQAPRCTGSATVSAHSVVADGVAEGCPSVLLVPTSVEIAKAPPGAMGGSLARTPELTLAWGGAAPQGSRFDLLACLVVDWFNPPFQSIVNGSIRRLHVAWQRSAPVDAEPMLLVETREPICSLHRPGSRSDRVVGLVAELAVASTHVAAFAAR